MMLVSTDNVQILAKDPWIVDKMLFVKLPIIDQSACVPKATRDHLLVKDVSRLVADQVKSVKATNGVTQANVKTLAPILALVDKMLSVVFCIIKHCVLVLLVSLEIPNKNVFLTWMNVQRTRVVPILDVST